MADATDPREATPHERLDNLLRRWLDLEDQGTARPEDVCASDPDLLPAFLEKLHALQSLENLLGAATPSPYATTVLPSTPSTPATSVVAEPLPSVAELVDMLKALRLVTPEQEADLAGAAAGCADEPRTFIDACRLRGLLTPFQSSQLLSGRGKTLLLGSYVLLDRLGQGGMGMVFKARNWKLDRVVALKVLRADRLGSAEARQRFEREIHAASQLQHPHIVRALDAGHVGDTHFFVMELVAGQHLGHVVERDGPLAVARACEFVRQAALGLQHAHEKGIVHRDVKPHNLLVTPASATMPLGLVKILDMGLALTYAGPAAEAVSTMTSQGSVLGTPDYIAPEQARDSHQVDARADLYSLGCTFFFLLTGRPPFPAGPWMDKVHHHWHTPPPDVAASRPDVPASVRDVVHKLMAKDPADRYQTAAELAVVLQQLARGDPASCGPVAELARVPITHAVAVGSLATSATGHFAAPPPADGVPIGPPTDTPGEAATAVSQRDSKGRHRSAYPWLLAGAAALLAAAWLLSR